MADVYLEIFNLAPFVLEPRLGGGEIVSINFARGAPTTAELHSFFTRNAMFHKSLGLSDFDSAKKVVALSRRSGL